MAVLSEDLNVAEGQIREALRSMLASIDQIGTIQIRDREANTLSEYLKIVPYTYLKTRTARGAFIKFRGFDAEMDDPSHIVPPRLTHEIEFVMQFEDQRKDGTNSDQDFTRIQMEFFARVTNDRFQSYENLYLLGPTRLKDAEVKKLDNKDRLHTVKYLIESIVGEC